MRNSFTVATDDESFTMSYGHQLREICDKPAVRKLEIGVKANCLGYYSTFFCGVNGNLLEHLERILEIVKE